MKNNLKNLIKLSKGEHSLEEVFKIAQREVKSWGNYEGNYTPREVRTKRVEKEDWD